MVSLEELRKTRISKVENFRKEGINPFPSNTSRTHKIIEVLDAFDSLAESKKDFILVTFEKEKSFSTLTPLGIPRPLSRHSCILPAFLHICY